MEYLAKNDCKRYKNRNIQKRQFVYLTNKCLEEVDKALRSNTIYIYV